MFPAVIPAGVEHGASDVVKVEEPLHADVPPPLQTVCTWNSYVVFAVSQVREKDVDAVDAALHADDPEMRYCKLYPVAPAAAVHPRFAEDEVMEDAFNPPGAMQGGARVVNDEV